MPVGDKEPSKIESNDELKKQLQQLLKRHILMLQNDSSKGLLAFSPSLVQDVSHVLETYVKRSGLLTFIVSGRGRWDPRDPYFERVRELARKGVSIERLFLLPQRILLRDEHVIEHWRIDKEAGIKTTFLLVDEVLPLVEAAETLDYGIWDNSVVCFVHMVTHGVLENSPEWRISTRIEDIELARATTRTLLTHGTLLPEPDVVSTLLDLEEPMTKTAPFSRMLAEVVCRGSYLAGDTCAWYHGIWQYLRIFDMVSTPTWHKGFYSKNLEFIKGRKNSPSVLVSGTADYSTLAHVLWYGWDRKTSLDVVVIDLCETPLLLCRWYAQRQGIAIETIVQDILTYQAKRFDLIVTDAFLTRFNNEIRKQVVAKWFELLKPGGRVITTIRLRNESPKPTENQVEEFRERALTASIRWRNFLDMASNELAGMAAEYASRMKSFPVPDISEVNRLFCESGFIMEKCDKMTVSGELEKTVYAEIVASKPLEANK